MDETETPPADNEEPIEDFLRKRMSDPASGITRKRLFLDDEDDDGEE